MQRSEGVAARHEFDPGLLAQFFDQEKRQVYARDLRHPVGGPLTYLPSGAADSLRADCHAGHLVCPFEDCVNPGFTTVGGSKRHHFRHHVRPVSGHEPERIQHRQAKSLLLEWVVARYPKLNVAIEASVECGRVADVLVTSPKSGKRLAFEIQYSAITVSDWRSRQEAYTRAGIQAVWLWGDMAPHLKLLDSATGEVTLSQVQRACIGAGGHLLFVNPVARLIGTVATRDDGCRHGGRNHSTWQFAVGEAGMLLPDPIDECRLTEKGLETPAMKRIAEWRTRAREAEQEERLRQLELERAERAREADRERRRAWGKAQREKELAEWAELQVALKTRYGEVPGVILRRLPSDRGLKCHYALWHGRVFQLLREQLAAGVEESTLRDAMLEYLLGPHRNRRGKGDTVADAEEALDGFLVELERAGWLRRSGSQEVDPRLRLQVRKPTTGTYSCTDSPTATRTPADAPPPAPLRKARPPLERTGACRSCGTTTNDWVVFDGATGECLCRSCSGSPPRTSDIVR